MKAISDMHSFKECWAFVCLLFLLFIRWNASQVLCELWCGIINQPAPAEGCRFTRLTAAVKTRGKTEGGKTARRRRYEAQINVERHEKDTHNRLLVHTHTLKLLPRKATKKLIPLIPWQAHTVHGHTLEPNHSHSDKWKTGIKGWMDWWTVFITFQSSFGRSRVCRSALNHHNPFPVPFHSGF